jgi:hypothetical protein
MKKLIPFILMTSALVSCDDGPQQRIQQEQTHQIEIERQQRIVAQQQAHEDQQSRNLWQSIAFALGIASVAFLGIGACLGSSARKHVQRD